MQRFRAQYDTIEQAAQQIFDTTEATTRKEYAALFTKTPYSAILFRMLDRREYTQLIWKQLSANPRTFKVDKDE